MASYSFFNSRHRNMKKYLETDQTCVVITITFRLVPPTWNRFLNWVSSGFLEPRCYLVTRPAFSKLGAEPSSRTHRQGTSTDFITVISGSEPISLWWKCFQRFQNEVCKTQQNRFFVGREDLQKVLHWSDQ